MSENLSDEIEYHTQQSDDIELDFHRDPRVQWFKERILTYIGMEDDELFYSMLEESDTKKKLTKFITASLMPNELSLDKKTFYICKIIVDKLIHEDKEFTEWRIVPPPPPPPPPPPKKRKGKKGKQAEAEPTQDETFEGDALDNKGVKAARSGKSVKSVKSAKSMKSFKSSKDMDDGDGEDLTEIETAAALTDYADTEDETKTSIDLRGKDEEFVMGTEEMYAFPPPPEDLDPEIDGTVEFYTVVRSVPRIIQYPKLLPLFGAFTPQVANRNRRYIYFLRQSQEGVPMAETDYVTKLKMPEYILTGCASGKVLMSLGMQLKEMFIPLFSHQFREVTVMNMESSHAILSRQVSYAGDHYKMDETASQVNYLRPSDYRRMSNIARGENAERRMKSMRAGSQAFVQRPCNINTALMESLTLVQQQNMDDATDKQKSTSEEVISDIQELVGIVEWTIEHIEGEIHMPMPNIPILADEQAEVDIKDPKLVTQLEEAVNMWQTHIDNTITACLVKTREGDGPVAEYKYWRERDAELSLLVEQLKQPIVVKILNLLEKTNSPYLESFRNFKERLLEQYNLAGDNLKFLSTLLRFFNVIEDDSPLQQVIDIMPELMESIYMVWVLSKGYRTDETMVPLMARISWALCNKLERFLNVHKLFDKSNEEVLSLARAGQKIMELWHTLYKDTRRNIELSGKGARWEFEQPLLFTTTDYIGTVARDLADVVQVLIDFERIFGAELKSIISDPTQIDDVRKRVKNLVYPIRTIDFSVFVFDNKENWDVIMSDFWKEVRYLEDEAKNYINQSFGNLRSAEEALDVLLKFLEFDTRKSIRKELSTKFDLVMRQFIKEITAIEDKFTVF